MAPTGISDQHGFWGERTATIDWCEKNYVVSYYIAEFWNTLSNLFIIIPPIFGIIDVERHAFIERRFLVAYLSLLVIGIGSTLFHMTLLFHMQMLDEIPMIYGASIIGYVLYEINSPKNQTNYRLAIFLFFYCATFTVAYAAFNEPRIHEIMFIILSVAFCVLAALRLMKYGIKGKCLRLYAAGCLCYALGGIVWNLDNHVCPQLEYLRDEILPSIFAPLSQFHAWWHFFSGYGTYLIIVACTGYRQMFLNRDFVIKYNLIGPVIRLRDPSKSKFNSASPSRNNTSEELEHDCCNEKQKLFPNEE